MDRRFRITLSVRLILFSSLIVIIAVAVMGILFTFFLNRRFKDYLIQENADTRQDLVQSYSAYMAAYGTVDMQWLEHFSNVYMDQGMFISVKSPDGEEMWSCMDDENNLCMNHMTEYDLQPADFEKMERETYEIPMGTAGESTMLSISFISPDSYSENDRFFLGETFRMLLISIVITLVISAFLSYVLSRSISRPLSDLTDYAVRLSSHDYGASDRAVSSVSEIALLHEAVANLALSLESQEKLRRRLTADVSHELRTPLTSLQTTLEAMIDGIWPADRARLEICRGEILRLSGLVKNLDDLQRYDAPDRELELKSFRLSRSLKKAASLFEKDLDGKDINLLIDCPDIVIKGDNNRLNQVWINLLSNSLKFTSIGGYIAVTVRTDENVTIRFSDTGLGIEEEDLPHIFERFYKSDSSRNSNGSGLGLSIVKEIIQLHGGSVRAESNPGLGTDIYINLPL